MKILILDGPNMNLIGTRQPEIYGTVTFAALREKIKEKAAELGAEVAFFQSNHEGALVDAIQNAAGKYDGILLNAAAYTHTSIAIPDAVLAVGIPTVEVHLSDPDRREPFRKINFLRSVCRKTFSGKGADSYLSAIEFLVCGEKA